MIHGLPDKLKQLRSQYGFTQRQLASMIDVSPSIISGYETGERTPSTDALLALSDIYSCSTDYLLGKQSASPSVVLDVEGLSPDQLHALKTIIRAIKQE